MIKRDSLLFVYGTLRAFVDIPMACRLRRCARPLGTARAPGRLYDLGPYPGLTAPRRRGEYVVGDLYELRAPRGLLQALDVYEGAPGRGLPRFVRVRAAVVLTAGGRRSAWLYRYRPPVRARARIRCGDYALHLGAACASAQG